MEIFVEDIYFSENCDSFHIWFGSFENNNDKLFNYTNKKFEEFTNALIKTGFEKIISKTERRSELKKGDIVISKYCGGRSIEVSLYAKEVYNNPQTYLEKIGIILYGNKILNYFVNLMSKENLKFEKGGKIRNYYLENAKSKKTSEEKIINHFRNNCWHKPDTKNEDFKLSMWDGTTVEDYNNKDRDGKVIYNGQIKYFRRNGYLCKGKVYHNINNMWWVIPNDKTYFNMACFELFDLTNDDLKYRKLNPNKKPAKYLDKFKDKFPIEYSLKEIVYNKIDIKKVARAFTNYCENYAYLDRVKKKKDDMPSEYYYVSNEYNSKTFCELKFNNDLFEIVYRNNSYIIVYFNEERIFEVDSRIRHWNLEKIKEVYNKHKKLFDLLKEML